jgi:ABC-2 type transport system permease protein
MMRLPNDAISAWEVAVSLLVLVGSVVVATWVAAKVFRIFLLMYGRQPALKEIVGYIRES